MGASDPRDKGVAGKDPCLAATPFDGDKERFRRPFDEMLIKG